MNRVVASRRTGLLLGALVFAHAVVIAGQVDAGGGSSLLERVLLTLLSPFQRLVAGASHGTQAVYSAYLDLRGVHQDNARLRERVRQLETRLQEREARAREAERLRALLELEQVLPLDSLVAEVIARDGLPWFRTLTLNRGSADGIALNDPVLDTVGVLGRVIEVGPAVARVQLLLDRDSGAGVLLERTRAPGVVSGRSGSGETSGELDLLYVPAASDVQVGDVVVTSGLDRIYPKGLVVGRVSAVRGGDGLFLEIRVTPSARFDTAEEVLVVHGPRREAFEFHEEVR